MASTVALMRLDVCCFRTFAGISYAVYQIDADLGFSRL